MNTDRIKPYAKAAVAAGGAAAAIAVALLNGDTDANDAITMLVTVLTAFGVWAVPNSGS